MSVLNRRAQGFRKRNRRVEVKAVDGRAASRHLLPNDGCSVQPIGEWVTTEVPRAEEIVLRTGSVDRGQFLAVDKEHVVAFTPPLMLILQHRHGYADEVAAAGSLHPNVVAFSVQILF